MVTEDDVLKVQRLYPQIYLACHKQHVRATSTSFRISSQDASILVHLDHQAAIAPQTLAAHLGIKPPALSAALARLARLGDLEITIAQKAKPCMELNCWQRQRAANEVLIQTRCTRACSSFSPRLCSCDWV